MEPSHKPLEVESLITEDQRRTVSVAGHHEFRESISSPSHAYDELDEVLDEALADPIRDHTPQHVAKRKVNKVLSILDQLDRENSNRRFRH